MIFARLRLKSFFYFSFATLLISPAILHAASILDVGTNYRLRGVSLTKADYGASSGQDYGFYSQRAQAHIGGRFSPNIEMMTQFQAIGFVGSTSTAVSNPSVNPTGSRYPNTNFQPWMQWAYLKASQLYDWPVDITLGRQPILLGDGLILSDDDLGFTGIRLQSRLPWYNLRADAFTFKTADVFQGSADADLYGIELTKPMRNLRIQLAMVTERDGTGNTVYLRPSENVATYPAGTDFRASQIRRTFYDARLEGRLLQGGFYKGEFALQNGSVDRSSSTLGTVNLGGYAFLLSAGLFTRTSKYGPIEVHGTFGMASGDSGGATDKSFRPSFGHRFDGLDRSGFGELFGASLYDALPSSANATGLPPGFSGIRVIGGGVTTHPTQLLSVGIDYFVFDAMESPGSNFAASSSESSLGSEFDIGAGFAYTNYLSFRASAAFFSPGKAFANREQSRRFLIEAVGRF